MTTVTTTGDVTIGDDVIVTDDATIGGDCAITGSLTVGGVAVSAAVPRDLVCGRLSLTSATPVTIADVTAATTLYWALYKGNQIALYSGTEWVLFALSELSIAVPATTSQMYDVFVNYNAGTPALSLTAWTNDTTRATALTTQDGVLVLTGSTGKRYVGSFRTTGVSGQTEDSFAKRHVWNYYNRVERGLRVLESTDSWTYDSSTLRQANNSTANQLDVVIGVAEVAVQVHVIGQAAHNAGSATAIVSIGQDSTSATATGTMISRTSLFDAASIYGQQATLRAYPAVGRHFFAWLESGGGATTTFYGDNAAPTLLQSGISGVVLG